MIVDLLPKFEQIEVNNLKGLQPGFVVAQMPVKEGCAYIKDVNGVKYFENGHICAISVDGIKVPEANDKVLFISYNDPINTIFKGAKLYATNLEEEHVRLVQLIPGDEWMSTIDYFAKQGDTGAETYKYAGASAIEGRVVKVEATSGLGKSDDWFDVTEMPDGTKAYHYIYLG